MNLRNLARKVRNDAVFFGTLATLVVGGGITGYNLSKDVEYSTVRPTLLEYRKSMDFERRVNALKKAKSIVNDDYLSEEELKRFSPLSELEKPGIKFSSNDDRKPIHPKDSYFERLSQLIPEIRSRFYNGKVRREFERERLEYVYDPAIQNLETIAESDAIDKEEKNRLREIIEDLKVKKETKIQTGEGITSEGIDLNQNALGREIKQQIFQYDEFIHNLIAEGYLEQIRKEDLEKQKSDEITAGIGLGIFSGTLLWMGGFFGYIFRRGRK